MVESNRPSDRFKCGLAFRDGFFSGVCDGAVAGWLALEDGPMEEVIRKK
jgi:hypothetical protein